VRRLALVPLLAAVAVAGCGGSSGGGSTSSTSGGAAASADPGKKLFTTVGCSSCHTLADAGASGHVGPDLDTLKPSQAKVVRQVTNGGGGMPAFRSQLSSAQIQQVAAYVAKVAGK
jgi:mono/diheme cytochrome c family protein